MYRSLHRGTIVKARLRHRLHFRITSDGVRTCARARAHSTALFSFAWQGRAAPRDVWGRQVVRYAYICIRTYTREGRWGKGSSRAPCSRGRCSRVSPQMHFARWRRLQLQLQHRSNGLVPVNSIVSTWNKRSARKWRRRKSTRRHLSPSLWCISVDFSPLPSPFSSLLSLPRPSMSLPLSRGVNRCTRRVPTSCPLPPAVPPPSPRAFNSATSLSPSLFTPFDSPHLLARRL